MLSIRIKISRELWYNTCKLTNTRFYNLFGFTLTRKPDVPKAWSLSFTCLWLIARVAYIHDNDLEAWLGKA